MGRKILVIDLPVRKRTGTVSAHDAVEELLLDQWTTAITIDFSPACHSLLFFHLKLAARLEGASRRDVVASADCRSHVDNFTCASSANNSKFGEHFRRYFSTAAQSPEPDDGMAISPIRLLAQAKLHESARPVEILAGC